VVGSVNASEFFVTVAIGSALIAAFVSGRWADGGELVNHAAPIAGLIAGGLISAPIAGKFVSVIPRQVLGVSVGILILGLSGYQALALAHAL
jgi:uncharacterized membrane protein YfcA